MYQDSFSNMGEAGDRNNHQVISPQRVGYKSDVTYMTYCKFMCCAQRDLQDGDLPNEVPSAFVSLRDEVLVFLKTPGFTGVRIGLYAFSPMRTTA